jgi:HAD superfamily hydrolase (TIGR01490 family)
MARRPQRSGRAAESRRAKADLRPAGIAFFDFDNTILHGDAGPLFGRSLVSGQLHERRFWSRVRLRLRYAPYITWMAVQAGLYGMRLRKRSSLVRSAYLGLRGVPAAEYDARIDAFVDAEIPPRIYPEMRRVLQGHLDSGHRCVIITTGMEPLIRRAVRHLPEGIEVIGCRMLTKKGKLTGKVVGPLFGVDKANILDAYCRAIGVSPKECWSYSDHWSDKQMLEAVGHGVAVNPRRRFRRLAERMGWRILEAPDPMVAPAASS